MFIKIYKYVSSWSLKIFLRKLNQKSFKKIKKVIKKCVKQKENNFNFNINIRYYHYIDHRL